MTNRFIKLDFSQGSANYEVESQKPLSVEDVGGLAYVVATEAGRLASRDRREIVEQLGRITKTLKEQE